MDRWEPEMIKVLIAEGHARSIKKIPETAGERTVSWRLWPPSRIGYEAVMKTVLCQPDVMLMDIEMETRDRGAGCRQPDPFPIS